MSPYSNSYSNMRPTPRFRIGSFFLLVLSLTCLSLAGCATLTSVRAAKGSGISKVFPAPVGTVWASALQATSVLGLGIAVSNEKEGYILAETGISAFSWGEKVSVFIDRVDDSHARIEVVSKRVVTTNVFAYNWENRILDKVDEILRQTSPPTKKL